MSGAIGANGAIGMNVIIGANGAIGKSVSIGANGAIGMNVTIDANGTNGTNVTFDAVGTLDIAKCQIEFVAKSNPSLIKYKPSSYAAAAAADVAANRRQLSDNICSD